MTESIKTNENATRLTEQQRNDLVELMNMPEDMRNYFIGYASGLVDGYQLVKTP